MNVRFINREVLEITPVRLENEYSVVGKNTHFYSSTVVPQAKNKSFVRTAGEKIRILLAPQAKK